MTCEWDFAEQSAAGEDFNREMTDHERMCQHYGIRDWGMLSNNERSDYLWNWKAFDRKIYGRTP